MRIEGWEQRLDALVAEAQTRDFRYGEWDCALFACASIQAMTGADPGAAFRGTYADEAGCARLLAKVGGLEGGANRIASDHHFAVIPVLMAWRGDVVLARADGKPTLGVCLGRDVAFAVDPVGVQRKPITNPDLVFAWRIA